MEFLRYIEVELQTLSTEAKKKHPEVAEAADRAILRLRGMREQYATAIRRSGGESPSLSMFRGQDLLRPFLLACNHSDAPQKLIAVSLSSIQHLINRETVSTSDAPNVMRILSIQAGSVHAEIQLRVLQTLVMVVTWCASDLREESVSQALTVCLSLYDSKSNKVRDASYLTLRQLVSLLFDTIEKEVAKAGDKKDAMEKCANALFSYLCQLSAGDGIKSRSRNVCRALGLELLDQALCSNVSLFECPAGPCSEALKKELCPLIIQLLKGKVDFPLLVRLLRIAGTVMVRNGQNLVPQSEVILLLLLQFIDGKHASNTQSVVSNTQVLNEDEVGGSGPIDLSCGGTETPWTAFLAFEVVLRVLEVPSLLLKFYSSFDLAEIEAAPLIRNLVQYISQFILSRSRENPHSVVESLETAALEKVTKSGFYGSKTYLDSLFDVDAPPLPDSYILLQALENLLRFTALLKASTQTKVETGASVPAIFPRSTILDTSDNLCSLIRSTWKDLLMTFNRIMIHSKTDIVLDTILDAVEFLAFTTGAWSMEKEANACVKCLAQIALPPNYRSGKDYFLLPPQRARVFSALLRTMNFNGNMLNFELWFLCMGNIDQLDGAYLVGQQSRQMADEICHAISRLPYYSKFLDDEALHIFVQALAKLSLNSASQDPTQVPRTVQPNDKDQSMNSEVALLTLPYVLSYSSIKGFKSAGFVSTSIIAIAHSNYYRLDKLWDVVSGHLNFLASDSREEIRDAAITTLHGILLQELMDEKVEEFLPANHASGPSTNILRINNVFNSDSLSADETTVEGLKRKGRLGCVLFEAIEQLAETPYLNTKEAALSSLYSILQSSGQLIEGPWSSIFHLLSSVAESMLVPSTTAERNNKVWGRSCLHLSFNSLKLIVDDFLERIPLDEVSALINCIGKFAAQVENVNLGLTAVGMLWTVSDTYSVEKDRKIMWNSMLEQLNYLSLDERPEMRNCALNTFFAVMAGNGASFDDEQWQEYLMKVTFPLMDAVLLCTKEASDDKQSAPELKKGVKAVVHHSRDTDRKQWRETSVLAMQGLQRVIRSFGAELSSEPWFVYTIWPNVLIFFRDASLLGDAEKEVSKAGIEGLSMFLQLTSESGLSKQVKVNTGMTVVNGTLESAANRLESKSSGMKLKEFSNSRQVLWDQAWEAMRSSTRLTVAPDSEMSSELANAFIDIYRTSADAEFKGSNSSPENENLKQLLQSLNEILISQYKANTNHKRLSITEKSILLFFRDELLGCWREAIKILANFTFNIVGADESTSLSREAVKIIMHLVRERLTPQLKAENIPSLLDMVSLSFRKKSRTYLAISRSATSPASFSDSVIFPYWPASSGAVELIIQFNDLLESVLNLNEINRFACYLPAIETLHICAIAWVQGDLQGSLENQADFGEEFSINYLQTVKLLVNCVQSLSAPMDLSAGISQDAHECLACLFDRLGNVSSAMGSPESIISENDECIKYILEELISASEGRALSKWSFLPASLRRRAAYNVFKCCRSMVVCYSLVDRTLPDDARTAPLSIFELRCVMALDAIGAMHKFAAQSHMIVPTLMFCELSSLSEQAGSVYPFREEAAMDESVFSTEDDQMLGRGIGYLMALYPLLQLSLSTRSRKVRLQSLELLQELNVPSTVRRYWSRIEGMYSTIQSLRSEIQDMQKK